MTAGPAALCGSSRTYLHHRARLVALAAARGCAAHEAEDLVHDLFAALLRLGRLQEVNALPEAAQAALLNCGLKRMLINRWRDSRRQCRDARLAVSVADLEEEGAQACSMLTPAVHHDHAWARQVVSAALEKLREEYGPSRWRRVEPALRGEEGREAADAGSRVAVHRARRRLRSLVPLEELRAALLQAA